MSVIREILNREYTYRQSQKDRRTVYLTKMGKFIRAYDWSVWLLKRSGSPLRESLEKSDGNSHVFVGFPLESADKFMPEGAEVIQAADGTLQAWILPETQFPPQEENGQLDEEFASWFKTTTERLTTEQEKKQMQKHKEHAEDTETVRHTPRRTTEEDDHWDRTEPMSAKPLRLTDIARQILDYQLQSHSPEESVRFIGTLKSELLRLL